MRDIIHKLSLNYNYKLNFYSFIAVKNKVSKKAPNTIIDYGVEEWKNNDGNY